MLSETLAKLFASEQAKKTGEDRFVVLSKDEMGISGNDFHVATEEDLNTFFLGCPVIDVYGPEDKEEE